MTANSIKRLICGISVVAMVAGACGTDTAERVETAPGLAAAPPVEKAEDEDSQVETLRHAYQLYQYEYDVSLAPNGDYYFETSFSDGFCLTGYSAEQMTAWDYCEDSDGKEVLASIWTGVPSAGMMSRKPIRTTPSGSFPPHGGAAVVRPGTDEVEKRSVGRAHGRQSVSGQIGSATMSADTDTGRLTEVTVEGDQVLSTSSLAVESGLGLAAALKRLSGTVASSGVAETVDFGFVRVSSTEEASSRVPYEVDLLDRLGPLQLEEIFYNSAPSEVGLTDNPPTRDVVLAVYRSGIGEIVISIRNADLESEPGKGDQWADPLVNISPDEHTETIEAGWRPAGTWGNTGEFVYTVESYNLRPNMSERAIEAWLAMVTE